MTGQHSSTTLIEEDDYAIINPNANRNEVKEYFNKLKDRLTSIKKVNASANIEKVVSALNKLAGAIGNIGIGEINNSSTKASAMSDNNSVNGIIESVKSIVDIARKSGVNIQTGKSGSVVTAYDNTSAPAALNAGQGGAGVGSGVKLAQEVAKADAWAMIYKIAKAKTSNRKGYDAGRNKFEYMSESNNNAGELATGATSSNKGVGAKSNADLAAAVALKAMSKDGKFAVHNNDANSNDAKKVQEAAANAINKVLSVLHVIIEKLQ